MAPVPPVLVSCGKQEGQGNLLTVAWTGILSTQPPMTYVSLRPIRLSYEMIRETGEFAINLVTAEMVRAVDFCGVRSGRDCAMYGGSKFPMDKFAASGLHREKAQSISCPLVEESPLSLECSVKQILPQPDGTHDIFVAEIIAVDVDPMLLDAEGKLHLERGHLIAYAHGDYYELGRRLGSFGFSVKKNSSRCKRKQKSKMS